MKHILKHLAGAFLVGLAITACSPEEFKGADQSLLPTVEDVDFTLNVDQDINQITATTTEREGCYPVWVIEGTTYSSLLQVQWSNKKAGTYSIELYIANKNGISQASVKKTFTFDNTLVDWTSYYSKLNGKEWRIDYSVVGHMGCGPSGTDGTEWWKAQPNEKKDFGVYDDRLTFTFANSGDDAGTYVYNPGEGGTVYVNKGCTTVFPTANPNNDADFTAPVSEQTTTFKLESGTWKDAADKVTECVYIVFPAQTLFPYISNDEQWTEPRFRVLSITDETVELVYDNGKIAWHYTLTCNADE